MRISHLAVIAAVSIASTAHADTDADLRALQKQVAGLETRIRTLETINARYREALDFLEKAYQQQKSADTQRDANEPADDAVFAVTVADSIKANMIEGSRDAPVTIVWAFDLADPFGRRTHPVLEELLKTYAGKIRVVFKHEIVHPQTATQAHYAACAAANQGKFPEFLRVFYKDGFDAYVTSRDATKIDAAAVIAIAKSMKLDTKRFEADMNSDACKKRVEIDMKDMQTWHVNATPTYFVNGSVINGGMPKETFITLIDAKLKLVAASKVAPGAYYEREIVGKGEKKFRSKADAHH